MKKTILAAALALCMPALAANDQTTPQEPKREMRSTWVAGMGIDWPRSTNQATAKQQLITILDQLRSQNFMGVCVHVRPKADAYYKSSYEPWSKDISGTRGKDPGWDPLAFAIEECHKRGLECYAWVNPFRVNNSSTLFNTEYDRKWLADGWLIQTDQWVCFNPGLPAARKHCFDVIKEIYTNYAVDGMLFDDYFYPGGGMTEGSSAEDYQLWKNSGTSMTIADWRRDNVNTFVKELYDDIQATRPDMRFGIGPAGVAWKSAADRGLPRPSSGSDWQYDQIYADPLAWLDDGTIDFISPQIYWARSNNAARYDVLCDWWSMAADHFGRHNYVSIASYKVETAEFTGGGSKADGWAEIGAQIDLTRSDTRNNAPGAIYYNTKSMNGPGLTGLGEYLGKNKYQHKVLTPLVDWKGRFADKPVEGLALNGTTLSWKATKFKNDNAIVRYTVYAVPSTTDITEAMNPDGDGFDGKYLVDVTYATSYTLPSSVQGHWYAVCVYDGFGYESEPAIVGFSAERADAPTLLTPAANAQTQWEQTFTWSAVSGATYTIQLAADKEFADIRVNNSNLTSTNQQLPLDAFTPGSKAYWRVIANIPGKLAGYSEVRPFTAPQLTPAPATVLTAPADKASIEGAQIKFTWQPVTHRDVTNLRFELTATDFDSPLITRDLDASQVGTTIQTAALGKGTYRWRVVASGSRLTPTASAVRTFSVEDIKPGDYEDGYTIKLDPAQYPNSDSYTLESIWYRAVGAPFSNFSFVDDAKGSFNRGMVATDRHVFISGRSAASTSADIYLNQYDAATGEFLRRIDLEESGRVADLPCNDVLKDSKGNICISNLSLNIATTPVLIHRVNLLDGSLELVATLSASGFDGTRVDHVGIFGDVTSGSFTVFAAGSNSPYVFKWTVTDPDKSPTTTSRTFKQFYPSTSSHFGIAPRVHPISTTEVYVDGGATAWTLYAFNRNTNITGSFANAKDAAPADVEDNGGCVFTLGDKDYFLYNYASSSAGSQHALAVAGNKNFSGTSLKWVFPANKLGKVVSSTCSAPCDAVVNPANSTANLYVYSPGNGLAAYRLTDNSGASVGNIAIDSEDSTLSYRLVGRDITLSHPAATIDVYTLTGALVASASNAAAITLPAAGTYILRADALSAKLIAR